jgi:hypothetical protein
MTQEELIELLADKEHASWANWMRYLFSKCDDWYEVDVHGKEIYSGKIIPLSLVERWQKQLETDYAELSEREKQSDRDEVAHILPIIEEYNQSQIDPDTAITAFMGWLTSRDEVVGPFSSRHDPSVDLIKQFCEAQGWHASNERFHQQIKLLKERYPD